MEKISYENYDEYFKKKENIMDMTEIGTLECLH